MGYAYVYKISVLKDQYFGIMWPENGVRDHILLFILTKAHSIDFHTLRERSK